MYGDARRCTEMHGDARGCTEKEEIQEMYGDVVRFRARSRRAVGRGIVNMVTAAIIRSLAPVKDVAKTARAKRSARHVGRTVVCNRTF